MTPVNDDEFDRILKARDRLARREIELRQIIRHCNGEMDIVRRKLVKDLEVMEVLKGEIEKAGTGPMRDQLEEDFHNGTSHEIKLMVEYIAYVATLTAQKEQVEEMQRRKVSATRELEGIAWSDKILEERADEFKLSGQVH
jgi:hypothetical protein